ncbi:10073_t:CDS:1 [Dentiscutata heterogama]|uniref:10073_t:CDS:1 n=1 Tax=Dentiscutata heterogama TaxID=1316150 RepID=A0ACA9KFA7_9GLOM|nr:10073_t:CDS:1 [Dentiscutata heterogama]
MTSTNQFDIEKIKPHILENIKKIDAKISQQENAVIIVGETREGKTTLFNYLIGNSLFSKENIDCGGFEIYSGIKTYIGDPLNKINIYNHSISQTSIPLNQGEFWDCPGFGDSRGDVQNIINAYSIYMLTKNIKKLKVLIVVSEATIIEKSKKKLLNIIHYLGEIFKNNIDLVKGLCLVVTQNNNLDLRKVKNILYKILIERDRQENFSLSQRKILNVLSSNRSQIAFFNTPREDGLISDKDKLEIFNCIEKISYVENLKPSFSLEPVTMHFIKNLIGEFHKDIEIFMSNKFYPALLNYIESLIDSHDDTVEKLRESLNEFIDELENIISDDKELQQFENNIHQILSIINRLKRNDLKDEFSKKIFQLDFIKVVKAESITIEGNTNGWYHFISELIDVIGLLKSKPELKTNDEGQVLTFEGTIIGTEDIKNISNTIKEINVYSLNSIFIDKDIVAPGVFLTFISPQLRVIGKRTFNLKGETGPSHNSKKADDGIKEKINNQDACDGTNEKEVSKKIYKESDDKVISVYDGINENKTNDEIKDANKKINKNINKVEKSDRIHKDEESNGVKEIISKQDLYDEMSKKGINYEIINKLEASIEITKEKTSDKINIEEINDSIRIKRKASPEMHGKDGLPGLPGGNGGHFYAKGRNFVNPSSLTIDISGGDGGKGQDGGNGADGLCGFDSGKKMIEDREESALVSRKKISGALKEIVEKGVIDTVEKGFKFFLTFNEKYKEIYEAYNPGQEGGDAGRGGMGGNTGSHGTKHIEFDSLLEKPTIFEENHRKGIDGKNGSPGRGGKNGPKYRGIYINEISYSGFKGSKEFDFESTDSTISTVEITDSAEFDTNCTDEGAIKSSKESDIESTDSAARTDSKKSDINCTDGTITNSKESDTESTDSAARTDSKKSDTNCTDEGAVTSSKESDTKSTDSTARTDSKKSDTNSNMANAYRLLTSYIGTAAACGYNILPIVAKEIGKNTIKIGPVTGASLATGIGIGLAIPLVISPVSAHFSSHWEEKPNKLDHESFASDGRSPSPLNVSKYEESDLSSDLSSDYTKKFSKKLSDYNKFYKNFQENYKSIKQYYKFIKKI